MGMNTSLKNIRCREFSLLRFVPPAHHLDAWRKDYQEMRGEMFFGEVPTFDEIFRVIGDFEKRFNQSSPA